MFILFGRVDIYYYYFFLLVLSFWKLNSSEQINWIDLMKLNSSEQINWIDLIRKKIKRQSL